MVAESRRYAADLPDPSVPVRSLLALTKKLADKNPQPGQDGASSGCSPLIGRGPSVLSASAFRGGAALANFEGKEVSNDHIYALLRADDPAAEAEGPSSAGEGGGKGGTPSPKAQGNNKAVCRWFVKDEGRNMGQACKFVHDWSQVVKAERCLVCVWLQYTRSRTALNDSWRPDPKHRLAVV